MQRTKKIKIKQEEKYKNLLDQLDLKIDDEAINTEVQQKIIDKVTNTTDGNKNNKKKSSLLSELIENIENKNINSSIIKQQLNDLSLHQGKIQQQESIKKQEETERKVNRKMVKKDMDKWQPIIKQNRESDQLDFSDKIDRDQLRVNQNEINFKQNQIGSAIFSKVKQLQLSNEHEYKKKESQSLQSLTAEEQKEKLQELAKRRSTMFQQELKSKRIAKIKSKLYHKIKKKRQIKAQLKELQEAGNEDPNLWKQEIEKVKMERAKERITQRHNTKSKFTQQLLRFGGKSKGIQQTINDLNHRRRELLKKITDYKINNPDEISVEDEEEMQKNDNIFNEDDENDEQLKQKAIQQLESELHNENQSENDDEEDDNNKKKNKKKKKATGLDGLKFIQNYQKKVKEKSEKEAQELLHKLSTSNNKNLDEIFSDDELLKDADDQDSQEGDDDDEDDEELKNYKKDKKLQQDKKKTLKNDVKQQQEAKFTGRQKFTKIEKIQKQATVNEEELKYQKEIEQQKIKQTSQNPKKILQNFIDEHQTEEKSQNNQPKLLGQNQNNNDINNEKINNKQKIKNQSKQNEQNTDKNQPQKQDNEEESQQQDNLTKGLNINNLQQKYSKQLSKVHFDQKDIQQFMAQNQDDVDLQFAHSNIITTNLNQKEFQNEKMQDMEQDLPQQQSDMKGWGSWTGMGVVSKSRFTKEQQLQKKLAQLAVIKQKRKDGNLDNVIINEKRNKQITNYLVQQLPFGFSHKDQFNYLNNVAVGEEWNTSISHQHLIKPNVITKKGEIIKPINYKQSKKK